MSHPKSNDVVVLEHRIAMRARAVTAAKFIATRRRRLSVEQLAKIIFAAWGFEPVSREVPMRDLLETFGIPTGVPLFVDSYNPGDGVTRYRFFTAATDYFAGDGIFTALGRKQAVMFAKGFRAGRDKGYFVERKAEN